MKKQTLPFIFSFFIFHCSLLIMLGAEVKEYMVTGVKQQLDIHDLQSGTYFILVKNEENRYSEKLIVLR